MTFIEPIWATGPSDKMAHLVRFRRGQGNGNTNFSVAWCDTTVQEDTPAEFTLRCKSCMSIIARFAERATIPVPDLVRETVTVAVTRAVGTESARAYLERQTSRKSSWTDVMVTSSEVGR